MKFKLPDSVTRAVSRQILIGRKHSPTILFVGGVVGVGATVVTACRATLKLDEVLQDAQADRDTAKEVLGRNLDRYTESDYKKDMTVLYIRHAAQVCKLYAPSVAIGVLSIAALTGAHKIQRTRIAGLTAAYSAVSTAFSEYRGRVVSEYGAEKDKELRYGVEEKTVMVEDKNGPKKKSVSTFGDGGGSQYSRIFDEYNKNWSSHIEYNLLFLRAQQNWATDRLRARGHLFLNEVYEELGLEHSKAGAVVGWLYNQGGDDRVDFGIWEGQEMKRIHDFVVGREDGVMLDFNVDGVIYDKIGR